MHSKRQLQRLRACSTANFYPPTSSFSNLPQLTSTREKEAISKFGPQFKVFLSNLSDLIQHNISVPGIYNSLQRSLTDLHRYFYMFYNQLNKSGGAPISITMRKPVQMQPMIINAAIPFISSWGIMKEKFNDTIENGMDYISQAIDANFNQILGILESLQNSSSFKAGIHDSIQQKVKKLQQQVWTLQEQIERFFNMEQYEKESNVTKITSDLKNFSRTLNTAFSNEFANATHSLTNTENDRNTSYNCICDILAEISGALELKHDTENIKKSMEEILPQIENIAANLDISKLLTPDVDVIEEEGEKSSILEQKPKPEKEKEEPYEDELFDKSLDIDELTKRGFSVFKHSGVPIDRVKTFFDCINLKIAAINAEKEMLNNEVKKLTHEIELGMSLKDKLIQETQKVATLRNSITNLQEKVVVQNEQICDMQKNDKIVILRSTLAKCNYWIRRKADIGIRQFKNEEDLVNDTEALISNPSDSLCKSCDINRGILGQLEAIIGSRNYVQDVQRLINNFNNLQKTYINERSEKEFFVAENQKYKDSIHKILGILNVAPTNVVPIEEFCVQSVHENITTLKNQLDNEMELRNKEAEKSAKLEEEKNALRCENEKISKDNELKKICLKEVEKRICDFLKVKKSGRSLNDAVMSLLNQLEANANPLQPTLDKLTYEVEEIRKSVDDAEKQISEVTKSKISNEKLPIKERINTLTNRMVQILGEKAA